jgi:uncharacterized protein YbjT (DUF2867 family)
LNLHLKEKQKTQNIGVKKKEDHMFGKQKVFVVGATGQQGGAVAQVLLKKGHTVRALTRSANSKGASYLSALGAEIIVGDLMDPASLTRAMEDVDAVFMVTTPYEVGTEAETEQGKNLIDIIEKRNIGHTVFSSVGSADRHTGIPHFDSKYEVENHLVDSGISHTIIAPVFFMENWVNPWFLPPIKEGNVAMAMPGDRALQQISVEDIGRFAAMIIERPSAFRGQRLDIASDELTGKEIAELIGRKAERNIGYYEIPLADMRQQNNDFAAMFEWFDQVGYTVDTIALRQDYPDVGWTYFDDWLEGHDWKHLLAPEPLHVPEDRPEEPEDQAIT